MTVKVAQIAYTNTAPFFHFWPKGEFELVPGVPKELAQAARVGDVAAGPLPLVECWALENEFEPLGSYGIAAREKCRSVFVFSKMPFSEMDNITVGVTRESATSVILLQTLIRLKYGHNVTVRPGLRAEDDAWLVIGDQALKWVSKPVAVNWPHATDLATEWWNWQGKPFVFAQWVVQKELIQQTKQKLEETLQKSLREGLVALPQVALSHIQRLGLPAATVIAYLSGMIYELGDDEKEGMKIFREMVQSAGLKSEAAR